MGRSYTAPLLVRAAVLPFAPGPAPGLRGKGLRRGVRPHLMGEIGRYLRQQLLFLSGIGPAHLRLQVLGALLSQVAKDGLDDERRPAAQAPFLRAGVDRLDERPI